MVEQLRLSFAGFPDDVSYSNAAVATKAAEALRAASSLRQRIELVIYADEEEWVVVGVSSAPCTAPTPVRERRVRVEDLA